MACRFAPGSGKRRFLINGAKLLALLCTFGVAATAVSAESTRLDVKTIILKSVEANERDWEAAPHYDYSERIRIDKETRTNEVLMIEGSPYERLIGVNGTTVSDGRQADELRKLKAEIAVRQAESPQQRAERLASYEQERKRDHLLLDQLTLAFNFTLLGETKLGSHEVYELKATPRANYQPPNLDAEVLTGMEGKLWIDTKTFQWVKVTARVVRPVSIGGFLARVEPGTQFELEKMSMEDDIWLPRHFSMRSRTRILFLVSHRTAEDDTYFDYRLAAPVQIP